MIHQNHYKTIHWKDKQTTAEGWIVIHNLINNTASGGIFMHEDASFKEVEDLACTMSQKNSLQDPVIGGAKGGIKYDHKCSDSSEVLRRFLLDNKEIIEKYWNTGADLNTTNELIYSIVRDDLKLETPFVSLTTTLTKLGYKVTNDLFINAALHTISKFFNLSAAATGFSVATCVKAVSSDISPRIVIQGFGNVGSSLAYFLSNFEIGHVTCIIEKDYCVYSNANNHIFLSTTIEELKLAHQKGQVEHLCESNNDLVFQKRLDNEDEKKFLFKCLVDKEADIFSPCAKRYVIDDDIVSVLENSLFINSDTPWIIAGANNVLKYTNINLGNIKMIPEWVSTSGTSLLFNELVKLDNFYHKQLLLFKVLGWIETRLYEYFGKKLLLTTM